MLIAIERTDAGDAGSFPDRSLTRPEIRDAAVERLIRFQSNQDLDPPRIALIEPRVLHAAHQRLSAKRDGHVERAADTHAKELWRRDANHGERNLLERQRAPDH